MTLGYQTVSFSYHSASILNGINGLNGLYLWYVFHRWFSVSHCEQFETEIVVYKKFHTDQLYRNFSDQISFRPLHCPVWQDIGESITWYKVDSWGDFFLSYVFIYMT